MICENVPSLVIVLAWQLFRNHGQPVKYQPIANIWPYVWAIGVITVLTCLYTAAGGIKAVIWTDVVQATLMFGSALVAIVTMLHHIGGFHAVAENVPQMTRTEGYFLTVPPGAFPVVNAATLPPPPIVDPSQQHGHLTTAAHATQTEKD